MAETQIPIPNEQTVIVPEDPDMAEQPALSIGDVFANKLLIRPIIVAAVGLISLAFRVAISDSTVDNITDLITGIALIWSIIDAQRIATNRARSQAKRTHDAVYAPATTAAIATAANQAGLRGERVEPIAGDPQDFIAPNIG